MDTPSLETIRQSVLELAAAIAAPGDLLPSFDFSMDAWPSVELDKWGRLHYVTSERGIESDHRITDDLDELLYWIFADVTATMASQHELDNRIEEQDSRRISFELQEVLMGTLNNAWGAKIKAEHEHILQRYPYDDFAGLRATLAGVLRRQGLSEDEITRMIYERYPADK